MGAHRLGILCVMVSLLLHGAVAVVAVLRSGGYQPRQTTIYEVVLASGTQQTGAKPKGQQRSPAKTVAVQALPAPLVQQRPAPARSVAQPAVPIAVTAAGPAVNTPLPVTASTASPALSAAGSAGNGTLQAVSEADHGAPLLQLGSAGAPAFSRQVAPVYPSQARRLGREGTVVLKLAIDAEGRLQGVEVVQAAAFGFTEAALTAIRQSTYRPALKAGRPIQAQALITIRFMQRS